MVQLAKLITHLNSNKGHNNVPSSIPSKGFFSAFKILIN